MWRKLYLGAMLLIAVLLAVTAGCSSSGNVGAQVAKMNDSNIKRVANLYGSFQMDNAWTGPKDEETFKAFIKSMPPERLEMMLVNVNDLDGMFKSERDGKSLKVRYGVIRHGGRMGPFCAVAFEDTGVGGRRQVGITNASIEEVDDARYKELWEGKGMGGVSKVGEESPAQSPPSG